MGLSNLTAGAGTIITAMLDDKCTITDNQYINVSGKQTLDEANSQSVSGIACAWSPIKRTPDIEQLIQSGIINSSVTHELLIVRKNVPLVELIETNFTILVAPRGARAAMLFEQPKRVDDSFNPLMKVVAVLRNA